MRDPSNVEEASPLHLHRAPFETRTQTLDRQASIESGGFELVEEERRMWKYPVFVVLAPRTVHIPNHPLLAPRFPGGESSNKALLGKAVGAG